MPQITLNQAKNIAILILACITLFLIFNLKTVERKLANLEEINTNLKDTLIVKKDKEGYFVATIGVLQSYKAKTFIELATKDEVILKLQKVVSKYEKELKKGGNATVIGTQGIIKETVVTEVDTVDVYPVYTSTFNFKNWVRGTTKASKDSTYIELQFREELDAVIGEEKTGFLGLGKRRPIVEVTLHNPYNEVTYLRTYATRKKPEKNFGVGPVAAYGFGKDLEPTFFLGFGINYCLIKL